MPKKFSHFIFIITFILSLLITISLSFYFTNNNYHHSISKLKEQGVPKLDNQIKLIDDSIAVIKTYTKTFAKVLQSETTYDEKNIASLFKNFFSKELGVFQLRLLDDTGKELIRFALNKENKIEKSDILHDKSTRYYYQEAKSLPLNQLYISKLDLNEENGKIEIPHRKTIRILEKVLIADDIYFIAINYDLTTILQTGLQTTLFDLTFVDADGEINMHLDDTFAFSKQQNKELYWHDFIQTREAYVMQKPLRSLAYDIVISIKESQLQSLKDKKSMLIKKMVLVALLISIVISLLLLYLLDKYLRNLSIDVLHILKTGKRKHDHYFQEFKHILNKVEKQESIIHQTLSDLQKQKEFSLSILDSQSNFVLISDGQHLKEANKTLLDFLNFPSLEAFHKKHDCICDFFIKKEGYLIKMQDGKTWLEVVLSDIDKEYKAIMIDQEGQEHIFHVITRKFSDLDGNYVITLSDITELTTLQQELQDEVSHQLENLRTKDQQLLQQSRLAQMGEMISMIAHQWRQPLTAISATTGNLSLKLMMGDVDKKVCEEEITLISDYAQHLSRTVDDFRGFFKENKEETEITLEQIVDETLTIVNVSAQHKNIDIQTDYNCYHSFHTNASEFKQVVLNLIKNAEDALIDNEIENPTIKIKTSSEDTFYSLTVHDNAGGIREDIIDFIFDPYFSTKKEKDGTGLGLYMSKTIIEDHCHGSIGVENIDSGACFTIKINKILL